MQRGRKKGCDFCTVHSLLFCPSSFPPGTGSKVYNVKLFPEDPLELMVGETLTLNCTALVEFNTGVDIKWAYPGAEVSTNTPLSL